MKLYKNNEDILNELSSRIINDINNGYIDASYKRSNSTLSFYVNDVNKGKYAYLTLRLSDHKPHAENYINTPHIKNLPSDTTNISIEFPRLQQDRDRKNKPKMRVNTTNPEIKPFNITSYEYNYSTFTDDSDIDKIYISIFKTLSKPEINEYIDPFKNDPDKCANVSVRTAKIKVKKIKTPKDMKDISNVNTWNSQAERNYYVRYLLGDSVTYKEELTHTLCEDICNIIYNKLKNINN